MPELTLEALAKRLEVLEQKVAELSREAVPSGITGGTGSWDAAAEAARELRERGTYDFNAWREQRNFDREHAEDHLK